MIGWKRIVVTVGEKIGKSHLTYAQGAAAELVAMTTIGLADYGGLPVSTTHVLSSGVAGTMAANGTGLQWSTVRSIALAWVLTLPVCMTLAAGLYVAVPMARVVRAGEVPLGPWATDPRAGDAPRRSAALRHAAIHGRPGLWGDDPAAPRAWSGSARGTTAGGRRSRREPGPSPGLARGRAGGRPIALLAPPSWEAADPRPGRAGRDRRRPRPGPARLAAPGFGPADGPPLGPRRRPGLPGPGAPAGPSGAGATSRR